MDVCELSDSALDKEIRTHMHGDGVAIVVEDERLTSMVPIHGQQTLFGDSLDFGAGVDVFTAPLPSNRSSDGNSPASDQVTLPHNSQSSDDSVSDGVSVGRESVVGDVECRFPRNSDERFHFESNSRDSLVTLFPPTGYFQRGPGFLDMTRIVREGGTLVAVTGVQPLQGAFCDAKWWVPDSDDVELDAIRVLRYDGFKTPVLVSVFSVVSSGKRHPDARVVSAE